MNRYSFLDDYSEGCHPDILTALANTNKVQQTAYGDDAYSEAARKLIRAHLSDDSAPIFFVAGGTLANIVIISSILKSHEAVISANTGHIVSRETGAIEATGHKIINVSSSDGKLTPEGIENALANNAHFPHMAKPRLVYISNTTEAGTIYSKAQLQALSGCCKSNDLLLMMDGARLGTALSADKNDLSLKDVHELTDVFWIGGTKAGALIGEAIIIPNQPLANEFLFHIKQRGALLAKGRLLGLQFLALFENNLFFDLSRFSNEMASKLSKGIAKCGYSLAAETASNQIFPILPNTLIEQLQQSFDFYLWEKIDDKHSTIRLVTSWATEESQIDSFLSAIRQMTD
ncbi:MAG: threonine aldolase [Saprospiraceae bacterium]|jgi:threonine aldolase